MTASTPKWAFRAVTFAACVLLGTAGCAATGGSQAPSARSGGVAQPCAGESGEYTIGVSQANLADPYGAQMDADTREAAAGIPQFSLTFADARQDNGSQVQQVERFLDEGVDLIVITPNEAIPLTEVVKTAFQQGTPVLVLDREVEGQQYTSFIGADNVEVGRQAARFVTDRLLPGGGQIAEITGLAGSELGEERSAGFTQGIAGKNVQVVASTDGDWLRKRARQKAAAVLRAHPGVQVVYAHNDAMAEGAYLTARDVGRADLDIVGIGGLPTESGGLKAVESGKIAATFVYPTGGKQAVDTARRILIECQPAPKKQTLTAELVTRDNASRVYSRLSR